MFTYHLSTECPECYDGDLTIRHAKATRKPFIGCTNYPRCRFTCEYSEFVQSFCQEVDRLRREVAMLRLRREDGSVPQEPLLRRLKSIIADVHPDRFGGSDHAATLATQHMIALRDDITRHALR